MLAKQFSTGEASVHSAIKLLRVFDADACSARDAHMLACKLPPHRDSLRSSLRSGWPRLKAARYDF